MTKIASYEVVQINTGRRWLPAWIEEVCQDHYAYRADQLKKNGEPTLTRGRATSIRTESDCFPPYLDSTVRYTPEREMTANLIRGTIKFLRERLVTEEAALLALYKREPLIQYSQERRDPHDRLHLHV